MLAARSAHSSSNIISPPREREANGLWIMRSETYECFEATFGVAPAPTSGARHGYVASKLFHSYLDRLVTSNYTFWCRYVTSDAKRDELMSVLVDACASGS